MDKKRALLSCKKSDLLPLFFVFIYFIFIIIIIIIIL